VGEIIRQEQDGSRTLVRKATRVPIDLMAAIQRGDLRQSNRYAPCRLNTKEIVHVEGGDLKPFDPRNFYSEAEIEQYLEELVAGRRKYTELIADEGLSPDIIQLAERSFEKMSPQRAAAVAIPREITEPPELAELPQPDEQRGGALPAAPEERSRFISSWEPRRPPRPFGKWK
jgi:phosphoenolpyruvate carboxykinase (ATP)